MEKFIVTTGKTIDLAVTAALQQLGMDRDSVSVEILETPKSGFFGIGASPAKVKLTYEAPDEPAAPAPARSGLSALKQVLHTLSTEFSTFSPVSHSGFLSPWLSLRETG